MFEPMGVNILKILIIIIIFCLSFTDYNLSSLWSSYLSRKCFSHGCNLSFSRLSNWKPPRSNLLVNLAVRVVSGRVHQSLVHLLEVLSSPIFSPCGGKKAVFVSVLLK